jgi:hypothetical protein
LRVNSFCAHSEKDAARKRHHIFRRYTLAGKAAFGMTVFSVQVFKSTPERRWSNRYHVNSPTITQANTDALEGILGGEKNLHCTFVTISEMLVSTITEDDRVFISTVLDVPGERSFSTDALPLFNTLMARFSVGGIGDVARKYYRILTEGDIAGGAITPALITTAEDALNDMVNSMAEAGSPLCKIDGSLLTDVSIQVAVQERQLRRRNKRRGEPS